MKKLLLSAGAALCISGAAHASITPVLDTITPDGPNFLFSYHIALSGDEGLTAGSKIVIFDFAGYVPGSIISPTPAITATTELSSNFNTATGGVQTNPFFTDDPSIQNLVFTYIGPDFGTSGGPFTDVVFDGFSAESTLGTMVLDGFSARAISNTGLGTVGTDSFNNGAVGVAGVPEPAAWAMLIAGFGGVGALAREKRRRRATAFA